MFGAIIPGTAFHSRDEIQRIQDSVQRRSTIIDTAASTCTALDAGTLTGWRLNGYIPAQQYAGQDLPISLNIIGLNAMWEQGIALQGQLDSWATQLRGDGCNVPLISAPKPYGDVISAAKWIGGTLLVLGVLGVGWKALEVVDDGERLL
jgi:hypothetical protein